MSLKQKDFEVLLLSFSYVVHREGILTPHMYAKCPQMKIIFIIIKYIQSSTLSILLDFIGEKKIEKVDLMIVMKHVNENK